MFFFVIGTIGPHWSFITAPFSRCNVEGIKQHKARQHKTERNKARQHKTEQNKARQHKTERNKARQHKTEQNKARQHKTEQNKARQGSQLSSRSCVMSDGVEVEG